MSYEITATRKRPQVFDDLVDQEFVVATLKSAIKQGRIAHAYLFSGPRGVGKTSAARILAKTLNCLNGPSDHPCGACSSCTEITAGNSLDVIEIDGASNTSVNDVREIKDEVLFAPNSSRYKVYIIDEVHMLSNSAFNALLKTIEEPPPYIVFIFATTEIQKVPATIRSRCQQFNFRLISIDGIKERLLRVALENNIQADEDAIFWIAKESTGSLRDAYTLFDQIIAFSEGRITLSIIKEKLGIVGIDELNEILKKIATCDSGGVLALTHSVLEKGIAVEQFVIDFTEYMRNLLFIKHGVTKDSILGFSQSSFQLDVLGEISADKIELAIETLLDLYRNIRYSLNQKFELELAMSKLSNLSSLLTQNEIVNAIDKIRKELMDLSDGTIQASDAQPEEAAEKKNEPDPGQAGNQNILEAIIKFLHDAHSLTLASALEKVKAWSIKSDELTLSFDTKDKFQAELAKKDRKAIIERASAMLGCQVKLTVTIIDFENEKTSGISKDDRIETLKNIFDGEVIKGE